MCIILCACNSKPHLRTMMLHTILKQVVISETCVPYNGMAAMAVVLSVTAFCKKMSVTYRYNCASGSEPT